MERTLLGRLGALSARFSWIVIGAWLVAVVVLGAFAGGLPGRLVSGGFEVPGSQSLEVQHTLRDRFSETAGVATALVVVHHSRLTVDDSVFRSGVETLTQRVRAVEGVSEVTSITTSGNPSLVSPDRHTTYLVAGLKGEQSAQITTAGRIEHAAGEAAASLTGFEVTTGGLAAFFHQFNEVAQEDLESAELISFPITLLVLVVAFGSLVAAGLPLMLAAVSLVVTLGALSFLARAVEMSIYVTNTASVIGIGVGIDYALFIVTRFRDELRHGYGVDRAVARAVATAGQAVVLSGITVIVALAGMFLVEVQAFSSMAIGSMAVVAVAVLAAVTLLPAVLRLVGTRIDRLRIPFLGGRTNVPTHATVGSASSAPDTVDVELATGFWHAWAMAVMRRPWLSLIGSLAILLALAAPFAVIRLGQPSPSMLPADAGPRRATERLAEAFGAGVTGPVEILLETPGGAGSPANLAKIDRLTRALQADPDVATVIGLTSIIPGADVATYAGVYARGLGGLPPAAAPLTPILAGLANWDRGADLARITVIGKHAPDSPAAERLVQRIRATTLSETGLADVAIAGGATAANLDLSVRLTERLPLVVGSVLALSFGLLVLAFRSLLLPLKAVLMNLLSVGASYGLVVGVFQLGWGERALGFTSPGNIASFVPLFLFSILFGLSMDYEVFLMSRMKEEFERTGSNEVAVARGLEATARTITSAALIMVTVFAAFAAGRLVPFKEMGVGLAAAVFLDASLVRIVLVPAAMRLMGNWNWWMPRALDRWLPRIALERAEQERTTMAA